MNRSKNSHIRAPRSVTDAPISSPARRPKFAIDFFAFFLAGRWPVMIDSSSTTVSSSLGCLIASLKPTFSTIFSRFGISCGFVRPSRADSAGRTFVT